MVTSSSPFQLTEDASLNIVRSFAQISMIRREITELFPLLTKSNLTLPSIPAADLLQPKEGCGTVQDAISRAGLKALDVLGLCVFCSCIYDEPLGPSSLDEIFPWSKQSLRGVVLDLESTTLQDLITYIQHHVPVYYVCPRGQPTPFSPQLINARDRDGEGEASHHHVIFARKASKAHACDKRRTARHTQPSAAAPVQPSKKCFFLKYNNRFKQVSRNVFNQVDGKFSTHKLSTGIVDVQDLDEESSDEELFSDTDPIPDMLFVCGCPSVGQSSYVHPPPLTTPFTYTEGEPGWTSRIPSPKPPPQPTSPQMPTCPHPIMRPPTSDDRYKYSEHPRSALPSISW